ncbi:NRDE family protein [Nocardia terpenica]|nr:NRDE family protein [Nocardia terpenica]MBF6106206.1 NRDE family protein [Nocardia terpenica]MBF6110414.1 NRDE family protein [Nocardia terpenica]MBF6120749.1 NRDE family protein [Nocardia terpenica]MBF6151750.1 NRDE family protein [Nocardia terpenica]
MCLVLVGWQVHPLYAVVIAANRDEVYRRAAKPVAWREINDFPMLCGLDVGSGGTWLGITNRGRIAAVTDVPVVRTGLPVTKRGVRSRGVLVPEFLAADVPPARQAPTLASTSTTSDFDGFNLLLGDVAAGELWWASNIAGRAEALAPGVHGISNIAEVNPGWPKVVTGRAEFQRVLEEDDGTDGWIDAYLEVLSGRGARRMAPISELPDTGIALPLRKMLSARRVRMGIYGTRASTVLRIRHDGTFDLTERRFGRVRRIGETRMRGRLDTVAADPGH